jgi:shikimate kinase
MTASADEPALKIALVGPCASGKSTLAKHLKAAGYNVRQPTQEHSHVPFMWRHLHVPDVLIYLDVDYAAYLRRRPHQDHGATYHEEQHRRLAHAREHCDLYVDTSEISAETVRSEVFAFLTALDHPLAHDLP